MIRSDGRGAGDIREVKVTRGFVKHAEGSVLYEAGDTKVLCNATVTESVPHYKKGSGEGWITAEYAMLPRATAQRNNRDIVNLKLAGRSAEIQRLIGRSLRAAVDLSRLGERTIVVDCDVLQADGGTRTAAITGGFIAMALAIQKLRDEGLLQQNPIVCPVAAISVGKVGGQLMADLCYEEDSRADVDMNVILNARGEYIELQGTGERTGFTNAELAAMLEMAHQAAQRLFDVQSGVITWNEN